MRVDRLELRSFRNYAAADAEFHPECNVIVGENAQGKTNLLEALSLLSLGHSPRTRTGADCIRFGDDSARVNAELFSRQRPFRVELELFRDRRRTARVNGVPAKNYAALSEVLNTVLFRPEDLSLLRAGASERRRFLDTALCQLRPRYAGHLNAYNRALAQKTRILRDGPEKPELFAVLPEFNEQLLLHGAAVIRYRARFVRTLTGYAAERHRECSGGRETLEIRYRTVSTIPDPEAPETEIAEGYRRHMEAHAEAERAARSCLSGPHRDDLSVDINGRDAKAFASQGQTRTAALAMKLAERELYKNAAGEYPVLLLDDVLSELDPKRQEFVLNRVADGQIFITCCEEDRLSGLLNGLILRVHAGELRQK